MNQEEIQFEYQLMCDTKSDINEHLPKLKEYYDQCESITEFGVRGCCSLYAALASKAKKVTAYDIMDVWTPECDKLTFICANDLEVEIEQTDFLFIDSYHTYNQLKQELELHHSKVNKFIGFHDVEMFGKNGEDGGLGLLRAIYDFTALYPTEWKECYFTSMNNGLMIIERI